MDRARIFISQSRPFHAAILSRPAKTLQVNLKASPSFEVRYRIGNSRTLFQKLLLLLSRPQIIREIIFKLVEPAIDVSQDCFREKDFSRNRKLRVVWDDAGGYPDFNDLFCKIFAE